MGFEAVLLFFLVLSPGLIADAIYRFVLWRPDPEEHLRLTRALLLSVVGLLLYLFVAEKLGVGLAKPLYLLPQWWETSWQVDLSSAGQILGPWTLHAVACVLVAALAALVMKWEKVDDLLRKATGQSTHKRAWDEFAAANHEQWVIVKLVDGRNYYGRLGVVSGDDDGDFVLWNPWPYDPEAETYERTGVEGMFVPADQVASVLVPMTGEDLEARRHTFGIYNLTTGERIDDRGRKGAEGKR